MNKLRVIELFAGIGAYHKAFQRLEIPHEIVATVDYDDKAVECYNAIHDTNFSAMDITELTGDELPDCDVICYSPPCQSFSQSGRQGGFNDPRGILFFDALRIIKNKKPKYLIMENVKNLTRRFKQEFDIMLERLEEAGYTNYWKIVDPREFNIPQSRERVFVVSIRNDIQQEFSFLQPVQLTNKLSDIIEHGYVDRDYSFCIDHNYWKGGNLKSYFEKHRRQLVFSDSKHENYKYRNYKYRNEGSYIYRMLTPKEVGRLMGFDDEDYIKMKDAKISNTQMYKVYGNSIVVNVVESILKNLFIESGVITYE